jgi:pentatricopeptide repeat protein
MPDIWTYTTMMLGLYKKGLRREADALFRKMKEDGILPNECYV